MCSSDLVLAVRFSPPENSKSRPLASSLEIILVNARHDKVPLKADALAQAGLDQRLEAVVDRGLVEIEVMGADFVTTGKASDAPVAVTKKSAKPPVKKVTTRKSTRA